MNICMLTSTFLPLVGGRQWVVHHLATALTLNGHQVVVVSPYFRGGRFEGHQPYGVVTFGFRGSHQLKLTLPLVLLTLLKLAARHRIDVIHVHNVFTPGSWAYGLSRLTGGRIPLVGTPHGDDIQCYPELRYGVRLDPAADRIVRRNVRAFSLVTAVSSSVRRQLLEILGSGERIREIPNGIWTSRFRGMGERSAVRKKYGIPNDAMAVISVGRNHRIKGFDVALEALQKLAPGNGKLSYVFVGREMDSIAQAARRMGLGGVVVTPGELGSDELAELYQACDLYVSSSRMESFGLTTLEAMSAGLPCVVTRVGGNADLVSDAWGDVVEAEDPTQMAHAIRRLMESPETLARKGARARAESQRYDWSRIAGLYESVYAEALTRRTRA